MLSLLPERLQAAIQFSTRELLCIYYRAEAEAEVGGSLRTRLPKPGYPAASRISNEKRMVCRIEGADGEINVAREAADEVEKCALWVLACRKMSVRENLELYGLQNLGRFVEVLSNEHCATGHPNQAGAYQSGLFLSMNRSQLKITFRF